MGVHYDKTKCVYDKQDCFAYKNGRCTLLNNTAFQGFCKFYKSQTKFEKDLEKYPIHIYAGKDKYDFD